MLTEDKVIELFCMADDFCKFFDAMMASLTAKYKHLLDLSVTHLDGSHTPAVRGGESVEYQGRKKRKTTNALYFSDRQELPLAMSEPQKGNHNDLYEIDLRVEEIVSQLKDCGLRVDGLFSWIRC